MHEILRHNARIGPTRLKYLGIIQSVVTRMAANEFTTRKWSVALGSALIGWTVSRNAYPKHALVAAIPSSCFWLLDAYYLSQERCFRYIFERECAISTEPARIVLGDQLGTSGLDPRSCSASGLAGTPAGDRYRGSGWLRHMADLSCDVLLQVEKGRRLSMLGLFWRSGHPAQLDRARLNGFHSRSQGCC